MAFKIQFLNIEVMGRDLPDKMTWKEAYNACKDGWRLPTIEELMFFSLLHDLKIGMFLFMPKDDDIFYDGYYWSTKEHEETTKRTLGADGRSRYAWFVDLNDKIAKNNKKSYKLRVRLVKDI